MAKPRLNAEATFKTDELFPCGRALLYSFGSQKCSKNTDTLAVFQIAILLSFPIVLLHTIYRKHAGKIIHIILLINIIQCLFCVLNFTLPASRPNLDEIARTA